MRQNLLSYTIIECMATTQANWLYRIMTATTEGHKKEMTRVSFQRKISYINCTIIHEMYLICLLMKIGRAKLAVSSNSLNEL